MLLFAHFVPVFYVLVTSAGGAAFAKVGPYLTREDALGAARRDRLVHYRVVEVIEPEKQAGWGGRVRRNDEAASAA